VVAVVNTHAHFDHSFGNQRFPGIPIYGHVRVPPHLDRYERPMLADCVARGEEPVAEWAAVEITPPTVLVGDEYRLEVGGRIVDLLHLGRGHTDNDIVLHLPDASAWLVGDLVEESGPPMYGSGCFPLEWPGTCAELADRLGTADAVVPGHGRPVDRTFVAGQQGDLAAVAALITELHAEGVPVERVVEAGRGRWALPPEGLDPAVAAAYDTLEGAP
jgi:glyoxylase-like metal-dependent hydrolase (beta-lactamase superfamily II)